MLNKSFENVVKAIYFEGK